MDARHDHRLTANAFVRLVCSVTLLKEEGMKRAVLLHVVAVNFAIKMGRYKDDQALGEDSKIDWRRRVMAWKFWND